MTRAFVRLFLQGLAAILPAFVTIWVLFWLVSTLEAWFGAIVRWFLPEQYYFAGMGLIAGLLLVLAVGLFLRAYVARSVLLWFERQFEKTPFVKSIYGMFKDLVSFIQSDDKDDMRAVVCVRVAGTEVVGLVTRSDLSDVLGAEHAGDKLAVFLPMSYQMGGYTIFVPKSDVRPLDMDVETGLRFALTAGVQNRTGRAAAQTPPAEA